ncbi:MAG: DUF1080 domain-containing protein [Planctomycetota bacterium]
MRAALFLILAASAFLAASPLPPPLPPVAAPAPAESFLPPPVAEPAGRLELEAADAAAAALKDAPPRVEEILRRVRSFRAALAEGVSKAAPRLRMDAVSGSPIPGVLDAADDSGITILDEGMRIKMGWKALAPAEVCRLGRRFYPAFDSDARAGLAGFSLLHGLPAEAEAAGNGILEAERAAALAPFAGFLEAAGVPGAKPPDSIAPPSGGKPPEGKKPDEAEGRAEAAWKEVLEAQKKRDSVTLLHVLDALEGEHSKTRFAAARASEIGMLRHAAAAEEDRIHGYQVLFNGRDMKGWTTRGGEWKAERGRMVATSTLDLNAAWLDYVHAGGDYVFAAEVRCSDGFDAGLSFAWDLADPFAKHFAFRVLDRAAPAGPVAWLDAVQNMKMEANHSATGPAASLKPGEWNTLQVEVRTNRLETFLNSNAAFNLRWSAPLPKGRLGIFFRRGARFVEFRRIVTKVLPPEKAKSPTKAKGSENPKPPERPGEEKTRP